MRRATLAALLLLALAAPAAAPAATRCGAHPWCDPALSPGERARLVLAELTPDEKYTLMSFRPSTGPDQWLAGDVPRLGIPPLRVADGPQGIRKSTAAKATALPAPLALASSFDRALAQRYGVLIGHEATRLGVDMVAAPTINIARLPFGGRTFESFGEDPFLMSRMGVGVARGVQSKGVVAAAKHYAANNQEFDRIVTNAVVDERTLREIYLPHYEAALKEAGVGSVMLAYNRTNGTHMAEHETLVNGVLKREWGFGGFTVSDLWGARSTIGSANHGLDVELSVEYYAPPLLAAAVATGQVKMAAIDEHVLRLLRTMFRFGMFDRPEFPRDGAIDVPAHGAVAREAAERGSVLLKNKGALLPLDAGRLDSIAVIGADADAHKYGGISAAVDPFYTVTPLQGIERRAGEHMEVRHSRGTDHAEAAALARSSDVAVVVASDSITTNEGADKPCLSLQCPPEKGDQDGLIDAVAEANPRTIVVLETGTPVLMPWIDRVPAVLEAWYPGQEGGNAIARVLFGDVEPTGRLPITFPRREADLPTAGHLERWPGLAGSAAYSEGVFVGYRHYDERGIAPLFPFGHGLSYTSFRLSGLRAAGTGAVALDIENTGARRGTAVPQVYAALAETATAPQPPRQLKGFAAVTLAAGERRRVTIPLDRRALAHWDGGWRIARGCHRLLAGTSSRDLPLAMTRCVR